MSLQKHSGSQNVFGNACGAPRKSRGKCFGVCGSSRKSRGECFGVCASRASTTAFTETFAQAAQVPRHLPRRLRRPRKYHGISRDVCASRASPAEFTETFAQVALGPTAFTETFAQAAQVPRHLPRCLRKPRKYHGIYRDVCAGCASFAAFTETFAQVAQVPRHLLWRLRNFRRHLAALQGRVGGGVRLSGGRVRPEGLRIARATCCANAGGIVFAGVLCTDGNRVASGTYDPADAAIELPATLTIQRPRQSSCQWHLRSSGPDNRVASSLTTQRTWQLSCQRIKKWRSLTSNSR